MEFKKSRAGAVGLASLVLAGCSATAYCPSPSENARPAFLLTHGRHTTLVLSDGEGQLERFAYGDWRYYAQERDNVWTGVRALLWPTRAALARQEYEVAEPVTQQEVITAVSVAIGELHSLELEGNSVDELRHELNQRFQAGAENELVISQRYDFTFVPHPRNYWFWHNSNHQVADWMEAMGCEVRGNPATSIDVSE